MQAARPLIWISVLAVTSLTLAGFLLLRPVAERAPVVIAPVTDARLLAPDSAPGEWISHGRDYANQRYSPLSQIDRGTVRGLVKLWNHNPHSRFTKPVRNESTPLVVDGMVIYTAGDNLVLAVDARTGQELWRHEHRRGATALCCGPVNRGVALHGDLVFVATLDARLIALDRRTGAVRWDRRLAEPKEGYSFTLAPLAAGGRIIIGASGGEFATRGFLDAYDPTTGRRAWRFWTIPSPDQGGWWGRWADTTPDGDRLPRDIAREKRDSARYPDAWRVGGAPVWTTPAYDPVLDLLVFTTGNPARFEGATPPGDNLYSVSIVAVDAAAGRLRWYHQMVPHDIWDYDAASPPVLFDLLRAGDTIPAAGHASKTGWVYVVDRRTGTPLHRSEPLIPLRNIFPAPTRAGIVTNPGARGGSNWPPAAYSPRTGLFYVQASDYPMRFLDSEGKFATFQRLDPEQRRGTFSAVDVATGKIRWQRKSDDHLAYGGALATAGDLVFYSEKSGDLLAVDAETGERLWRYRLESKQEAGPPVSFTVDGAQRIGVTVHDGLTVFGLPSAQ
jgi:glucose dehydrogenase